MSYTSRITEMLIDTPDYYSARLEDGGVRIGLCNVQSFSFPPGHPVVRQVESCASQEDVEAVFDELIMVFHNHKNDTGGLFAD